jgi:hypothetical protein
MRLMIAVIVGPTVALLVMAGGVFFGLVLTRGW